MLLNCFLAALYFVATHFWHQVCYLLQKNENFEALSMLRCQKNVACSALHQPKTNLKLYQSSHTDLAIQYVHYKSTHVHNSDAKRAAASIYILTTDKYFFLRLYNKVLAKKCWTQEWLMGPLRPLKCCPTFQLYYTVNFSLIDVQQT